MTKKAIKDLPRKATKGNELNEKDLDKVTAGLAVIGLGVIGGIATRNPSLLTDE